MRFVTRLAFARPAPTGFAGRALQLNLTLDESGVLVALRILALSLSVAVVVAAAGECPGVEFSAENELQRAKAQLVSRFGPKLVESSLQFEQCGPVSALDTISGYFIACTFRPPSAPENVIVLELRSFRGREYKLVGVGEIPHYRSDPIRYQVKVLRAEATEIAQTLGEDVEPEEMDLRLVIHGPEGRLAWQVVKYESPMKKQRLGPILYINAQTGRLQGTVRTKSSTN